MTLVDNKWSFKYENISQDFVDMMKGMNPKILNLLSLFLSLILACDAFTCVTLPFAFPQISCHFGGLPWLQIQGQEFTAGWSSDCSSIKIKDKIKIKLKYQHLPWFNYVSSSGETRCK